jgi:tripartite-type tricarboxylate transporter receptor subunit TctC
MKHLCKLLTAMAFVSILVSPSIAEAQSYPTKPIKLIVPWPAGGATDLIARAVTENMRKDLGQMIVVENKPGATGRIGIEAARLLPADGYTLLIAMSNTHGLAPALRKDLSYDPIVDFTQVGMICAAPLALTVRASLPVKTLPELIDYAKSNPGKLTYASGGIGSATHLMGEMFKAMAGIDIVHVPYKGQAPAVNDLLAGHVDMFFEGQIVKPHVDDGKLRVLATTGPQRWFMYPDIPTTTEAGLPDLVSAPWWGLQGPKGMPAPIVERLNRSMVAALKDPEVQSTLKSQGADIATETSPVQMKAFIAKEIERWEKNLKLINYQQKAG